jgi:hypothetical protein
MQPFTAIARAARAVLFQPQANPQLIITIQAVHNADKPNDRAGQAQNDSGYDQPWACAQPPVEQVTDEDSAEDVRRKQRYDRERQREFRLFGPVAHQSLICARPNYIAQEIL